MATKTTTLRVIEPATEKVMAELQEATVEEADAAVARAKKMVTRTPSFGSEATSTRA